MSALKDQMASIMEAILGMERLVGSNAAAASTAVEANPVLPSTARHPVSDILGRGRNTMGHANNPHLGYNRGSYPCGLPPNFTPTMHDNMNHSTPTTFKGEPPGCAHEGPQEHAHRDIDSYPYFTTKGLALDALPQPNIARVSQPCPIRSLLFSAGEPLLAMEGREKLSLIKERLRAVKGFNDCPFTDMADPSLDRTQLWGVCK